MMVELGCVRSALVLAAAATVLAVALVVTPVAADSGQCEVDATTAQRTMKNREVMTDVAMNAPCSSRADEFTLRDRLNWFGRGRLCEPGVRRYDACFDAASSCFCKTVNPLETDEDVHFVVAHQQSPDKRACAEQRYLVHNVSRTLPNKPPLDIVTQMHYVELALNEALRSGRVLHVVGDGGAALGYPSTRDSAGESSSSSSSTGSSEQSDESSSSSSRSSRTACANWFDCFFLPPSSTCASVPDGMQSEFDAAVEYLPMRPGDSARVVTTFAAPRFFNAAHKAPRWASFDSGERWWFGQLKRFLWAPRAPVLDRLDAHLAKERLKSEAGTPRYLAAYAQSADEFASLSAAGVEFAKRFAENQASKKPITRVVDVSPRLFDADAPETTLAAASMLERLVDVFVAADAAVLLCEHEHVQCRWLWELGLALTNNFPLLSMRSSALGDDEPCDSVRGCAAVVHCLPERGSFKVTEKF